MLRKTLLASAALAVSFSTPQLAGAQQTTAATASPTQVDEIVVTGSRIRRPELTSVQPLQVITTQTMEERGFTNVADALNELPSSGIPINPIGDQGSFGTGRNFVNIFNLGTNRTLTLVNGRRFVGGNPASIFSGAGAGGQVDLNVIPTGLVDRIETVQAGGSAVYGSDAIAGVINIITRREFDGVELDGLYGISAEGDAETYRGRVTAGKSLLGDRLSISGSYEYNETSPLAFTDRAVTARQIAFAANPANVNATDNIPGAILIENRRIPEVTLGGLPFRPNAAGTAIAGTGESSILTIPDPSNPALRVPAQFGVGGVLIPYQYGTLYQASIASGGNGLNLAELSSLQSPVKRHVSTAFINFDITDNVRLSTEFFYSRFEAEEPFNQPIYNAPLFGGTSSALRISTANPFLPAASRAAILAQPTVTAADAANPGERIFFLSRASVDIGNNKTKAEGDTFRYVAALEGNFRFLDRDFDWDISLNQGRSEGSFSSPNIIQTRFVQAIDAVRDTTGAIVCRDAAARAAGCAPLNLFGLGSPSQAALTYVGVNFRSEFSIQQTVYNANLGGELFSLPAGPAAFNLGYEARYEKSDFNPNDPQEQGVGRSAAITALAGKFNTSEYYGELTVPIFGGEFNLPGLRRLDFDGQYRNVDHSLAGEDKAWTYGLRWHPIDDLLIRGQKSQSFRAPAITELFLPQATSFITATDPCDARNINSGPSPTTRRTNCEAAFRALGLPANFNLTSQVQAATVQGSTAGNRSLQNEIAEQWSAGFVYQPSFFPGLALSFDWVRIDLTSGIFNFALTSIMQVCYDSPTPQEACDRFQRGNSTLAASRQGQVLTFGEATGAGGTASGPQTGFINAGYINFDGFTAGIDYEVDLGEVFAGAFSGWLGGQPGDLEFNFDLFHVDTQQTSVTGLGFDLNRDEGEIGNSTWQWKLETTYGRGPFSAIWTTNYMGPAVFNNDFTLETRFPLAVDNYFIHDLSLVYKLDGFAERLGVGLENATARFIINNVGDVEAPYGTTGLGVYDVIGRYYRFGLTARF